MNAPAPVTRIARRRARPGQEAAYEQAIRGMFDALKGFPGFLGADLLPPESPGDEYQVVVRFRSEADLQAWDESDQRLDWHERLRPLAEGEPAFRKLTGLEAWFAPAVVPASVHPPKARMTLVTWLGIFPTVTFFSLTVGPLLEPLPAVLRIALLTALVVPTMTYLVMPRLTRWLRGFLVPSAKA